MAVTADTYKLSAQQRREIALILDARQQAVTSAWDAAWQGIADEVAAYADAWADVMVEAVRSRRRPNPLRLANLARSRAHIEAQLTLVNSDTEQVTLRTLSQLAPRGGEHAGALVRTQLPTGADLGTLAWVPIDTRALDSIIKRTTQQITARHYALSTSGTRAVRSALRAGVAGGEGAQTIARRMVKATEGVFNGGLARAEVIARTEVLDAYRAASSATMQANADLLTGWTWLCELSERTCSSCLAMNGSEHPVDEAGPIDHHQGRCTSVPTLKPWKALGLPGPEPVPVTRDAMAWFDDQPERVQRGILGNRGYEAWKAGDFPPSAWSVRRDTPEWRPAYYAATPQA